MAHQYATNSDTYNKYRIKMTIQHMTKKLLFATACSLLLVQPLFAASIQSPVGFDDGNAGWTAGRDSAQPAVQSDGGPTGVADSFLMLTGQGGNGPASIVASFNDGDEWTGDYATPGIGGLSVDLMTPADSQELSIRLVLFGEGSTNNRWTSTEATMIPNDGEWRNYIFPIAESDLTSVRGSSTYDAMIGDVVRLMLRHDTGSASAGGSPAAGVLGIDNIQLVGVPEPSTLVLAALGLLPVAHLRRRRS